MRQILKGEEPRSLRWHRLQTDATYENYREKQELRRLLSSEQRGLCCYCMGQIRAEPLAMKIAHWHGQHLHPEEQLDYGNLLGACLGGQGNPPELQHCDTRQGDRDCSRNPANPAHRIETLLRYDGGGRVLSSDAAFDVELNDLLGLNSPFLLQNRLDVLKGFLGALGNKQIGASQWERWEREWSGEGTAGELRPYCQVVVYWLRKRLKRMVS